MLPASSSVLLNPSLNRPLPSNKHKNTSHKGPAPKIRPWKEFSTNCNNLYEAWKEWSKSQGVSPVLWRSGRSSGLRSDRSRVQVRVSLTESCSHRSPTVEPSQRETERRESGSCMKHRDLFRSESVCRNTLYATKKAKSTVALKSNTQQWITTNKNYETPKTTKKTQKRNCKKKQSKNVWSTKKNFVDLFWPISIHRWGRAF